MVECAAGFDGGLTQLFTIELRYLRPPGATSTGHHGGGGFEDVLVRNVTLSKPYFEVRHLESGVRFEAKLFASNRKGRSMPVTLRVSTLKRPEGKRMATIASGSGRNSSLFFQTEKNVYAKLGKQHFTTIQTF